MENSIINNIYYNKYIKYKYRYNNLRNLYGGDGEKNGSVYHLPKYIIPDLMHAAGILDTTATPIKIIKDFFPVIPLIMEEGLCDILFKISQQLQSLATMLLTIETALLKGMYQIFVSLQFSTFIKEPEFLKLRNLMYLDYNKKIILEFQRKQISDNLKNVITNIEYKIQNEPYKEMFKNGIATTRYREYFISNNYYNRIGNTNIWNLTIENLTEHFIFELFGRKTKEAFKTGPPYTDPVYKYSLSELIFEEYKQRDTNKKGYNLRKPHVLFTEINYHFHVFIDEINTLYGIDQCKLIHKMLVRYIVFFANIWNSSIPLTEDITSIYNTIKSVLFENSHDKTINDLFVPPSSKIPTYPPFKQSILDFEASQKNRDDQSTATRIQNQSQMK